jgi:Arc/MetJ family transcription regulator
MSNSCWGEREWRDMRTTLNLDDDVFQIAQRYAESRSLTLGKAVSQLVREALATHLPTRTVNGIQVVDLPPGSPRITTKRE